MFPRFLIIISIFLLITGSISFYIFIRGWQALPVDFRFRNVYAFTFWIVFASFLGGRLLEKYYASILSETLIWIGSFWIAAMLYFFLAVLALDIVRLANHFFHFQPAIISEHYAQAKFFTAIGITGFIGLLLLVGHINSILPRIVTINIAVPKKASSLDSLNIAAASDIHLGTIIGRRRFDRIVEKINSLKPDVVLLPGDIFDEDLNAVIRRNQGDAFRSIKSRFGIFAVNGNHEYIGGVDEADAYMTGHGIKLLRDESIAVDGAFSIVGRDDRSAASFTGKPRKQLTELLQSVDRNYPVIVMDHQPFQLSEAANEGIDLQLSGHTHYGQLWPINYIIERIYELPWGYKKISATHFYVSDGVGTWGPPIRTSGRPEIVNIRIKFE